MPWFDIGADYFAGRACTLVKKKSMLSSLLPKVASDSSSPRKI